MFKNWSIRTKLEVTFVIMLTLIGVSIGAFVIFNLKRGAGDRFENTRRTEIVKVKNTLAEGVNMTIQLIDRRRQNAEDPKYIEERYGAQLKGIIDTASYMMSGEIEDFKNGSMTKEEAQKSVSNEVRAIRDMGKKDYIWVINTERPYPRMIVSSTRPDLEGKILNDPKFNTAGEKKENLFVAAVDICEKNGEGFINYLWRKPPQEDGSPSPQQLKVSYVRLIPELGWIMGVGVYAEDVQKDAIAESFNEIKQMRWGSIDGYFWILENKSPYPRILMYPVEPALNGISMDSERFNCVGEERKNLGSAFLEAVEKTGEGYVEYSWFKPTGKSLIPEQPKIAFVKLYKPYNWIVGTGTYIDSIDVEINEKKAVLQQEIYRSIASIIIALAGGLVVFEMLITFLASKIIIKPLKQATGMARDIAKGKLPAPLPIQSKDEISELEESFNQITKNTKEIVHQIQSISEGNYTVSIQPRSEHDELSQSLIRMTEALKKFYEEEKQQNWVKTGLTELNNYIHSEFDLERLATNALSFLAHYLCAPVGAIFIVEGEDKLKMVSYYAMYSEQNEIQKTLSFGEGLVGQVAIDKQPLIVHDVPESYFTVQSGLGHAAPRNLVILPLIHEDEIVGMLELGTFEPFNHYQFDFLQQAINQIAIAFFSTRSRIKQTGLLEETQRQSEKLLQSNKELEERTLLLEKQRQEIDRQNLILKNTAVNLQRASRELEMSSKYKSEFLANMSHELRTPLNSLLILSKLLMENKEGNLNNKQTEFAQTIHQSGSHLLRLINDILDLAKVEAGKMELHLEDVRIQDLCSQIEKIFEHVAKEKGLKFEVIRESDAPETIRSDGQRILQVLLNLLSNAFKFTKEGSVTLKVSKPTQEFQTCIPDPAIIFQVQDTGIGIPEEKQELIFQAFQQADGGTSRRYGGTGLGLSISKEFVRLLGGGIRLKSEINVGSAFIFCLPSVAPETKAVKTETPIAKTGTAIVSQTKENQTNEETSSSKNERKEILLNCWEYLKCGREKGGAKEAEFGVCPAYPDHGHDCAGIAGTLCDGVVQGTFAQKIQNCRQCEFFKSENYRHEKSKMISDDRGRIKPGQKSLLIIEDDIEFIKILMEVAYREQFLCLVAQTGKEGFQLAERYLPAAITLDLKLPDIDGKDVLEKLKNSPQTRDIPVYVITALERDERVLQLDVQGYSAKPAPLNTLTAILKDLQSANSLHLKKLLLIERDPLKLKNTEETLKNRFHIAMISASSAQQALDLLQKEKFNCLVTDLEFPDASGVEFLEKIQQLDIEKLMSIIVQIDRDLAFEEKLALQKFLRRSLCKKEDSKKLLIEKIEEHLFPSFGFKEESANDISDAIFRGKKVLIVDDDMRNAYALTAAFDEKGIESILTGDGAKALEQLEQYPEVDLVLMDIMMPVMNGYEAIRRIRLQERFKKLPIIAITAKALQDDRKKCIEVGADDYFPKPIDLDKLFSLMKSFFISGLIEEKL